MFMAKLKGGAFRAQWAPLGITNLTTKKQALTMQIMLSINGESYAGAHGLLYSSKRDKSGTAR